MFHFILGIKYRVIGTERETGFSQSNLFLYDHDFSAQSRENCPKRFKNREEK